MHRQRGFMDEIGCMRPENVHTENPVALRIGHHLQQPLNVTGGLRFPQPAVTEPSDPHPLLRILFGCQAPVTGLLLREPHPPDFR